MTGDLFGFGDYEPEDAWDAGDVVALLIDNLRRRVDALNGPLTSPGWDQREQLDAIGARLEALVDARRSWSDHDLLRLELAVDDLSMLRHRVFG